MALFTNFGVHTPEDNQEELTQQEEVTQQEPTTVSRGPSEKDQKDFAAYQRAVGEYSKLISNRTQVLQTLEQKQKQQNTIPSRIQSIKKELSELTATKANLETELSKQQNGGQGGAITFKDVPCDPRAASLVKEARDNNWMTPSQLAFVNTPYEEARKNNALSNAANIANLEKSFLGTALYKDLLNPTINGASVKKALGKYFLMFGGGLFVILLLARLINWSFLDSLAGIAYSIPLAVSVAFFVFSKQRQKGLASSIAVAAISGLVSYFIGTGLHRLSSIAPLGISVGLSAVLCIGISFVAFTACGSDALLPLFRKMKFIKGCNQTNAFISAESVQLMNEALYCYCNHDTIMDYLRNNARRNLINELTTRVNKQSEQIAAKERDLAAAEKQLKDADATIMMAKIDLASADQALLKANQDIRRWQGQPTAEMAGHQFSNMICLEDQDDKCIFKILTHNKCPMVFRYRGDATMKNVTGQVTDHLLHMINGFTKINPTNLIRVYLIDMVGGAISLNIDPRFRFVDWADLKQTDADNNQGGIFRVGDSEELAEFQKTLGEHYKKLTQYVNKHRDQLQGRSGIDQVNQLRHQEGQKPNPYQVLIIMVPRETDKDVLSETSIMNYLQDQNISVPYGILPVFLVNEASIHPNWKSTIEHYTKSNH